jgi:hypothetical protein
MSGPSEDEGPVLPRKPKKKERPGRTIYLDPSVWERLDQIAEATGGEYSRNEVIEYFLLNRIAAWDREQASKKARAK